MNNTIPALVARALRDHRTITWSYITGGGYKPYYSLTRSQILREVRDSPTQLFNFGLVYDPSRPPSTNGRHGLQAYAIIPEPPAINHAAVRRQYLLNEHDSIIHYITQARALLAEHGHTAAADQALQLLHTVTKLTPKTA
jgi:hypothetical protein